jgi:hypothetical protein
MNKIYLSEINQSKVQDVFDNFINDENLKVLALKGKWGVGKTHLVTTSLQRKGTAYYYSSLFGLSSIEHLKSQLLASNLLIGKFLGFINKNSDKISKISIFKNLFSLSGAVVTVTGDLLLNIMIANLKNQIFCIDDIERKTNIQLNELLGFIDYIVKQTESKVILIYNEEHLISSEDEKEILGTYREKIFDVEVLLNPDIEENINIVFKDKNDILIIQEILKKVFIKNIRIIRKIKFILDKIRLDASG